MKKSMLAVLIVNILMISLLGCAKESGHDIYKEIYKRYNDLNSFYAEAEVTVYGDKLESTYLIRQFYEEPDKFAVEFDAPEEIAGSGYSSQNGKLALKSGFGDKKVCEIAFPDQKNTIFLNDFFEEYYKSEETFVETNSGLTDNSTLLTCFIPGKSKKRFKQSLKIDNKTYLPLELTTYDIEENPVVIVRFGEFKRNCDIDDKIFN